MRKGFTLIELLTTMGIVGVLAGLLLPAIQASRESSRRTTCASNLRQVGLALTQHEQVQKALPKGAAGNGTYGFSWWVDLLPFLEQSALFDRLDRHSSYCGSPTLHVSNGRVVDRMALEFMLCPSSPLPPFYPTGIVETLMPSYVGISGATSDDDFPEKRVETCCLPKNDGQISGGGVLVPNRRIPFREVSDGLSRTIAVGECSDYIYAGGQSYRIDGGFNYGWMTGTFMVGTPPNYTTSVSGRPFNLTTVRYPPNMPDYNQPGVLTVYGINNPLNSAHPGGIHVVKLDGSVAFVEDQVSAHLLKSLSTRDDGIVLGAIP